MAKRRKVEEEPEEVVEEVVDPTPEATAQAEAVVDAAKAVADAKATLDEAQAAHKVAVDELAEANKPPAPEFGVHLLMEGMGRMPMPADWNGVYQFRFIHNGGVYDHVAEDAATGVWVYRKS